MNGKRQESKSTNWLVDGGENLRRSEAELEHPSFMDNEQIS